MPVREQRRAAGVADRFAMGSPRGVLPARARRLRDLALSRPSPRLIRTGAATIVAPNVLSVAQWERLLDGELYATTSRVDWRRLLMRTFEVDLRVCVRCGGKLTLRAVVPDPASAAAALAALAHPRAPPRPPAPVA